MKKGIPISPGVAVARAFCIDLMPTARNPLAVEEASLSLEVSRFDRACAEAAHELDQLIGRVAHQLGEEETAIFQSHKLLLRDPALASKVKSAILEKKVDAPTALHLIVEEYNQFFSKLSDPYLQERMSDIRDVVGRIQAHLARGGQTTALMNEPVILVAPEILPSQAIVFDRKLIAGIMTETGGATGHAAILSRALGIPAVSGLRELMREVHTGDLIALDGREGQVYINPGPEVEAAYRKLQREYVALAGQLIENRDLKAVSADGAEVTLLANVNSAVDARMASEFGAVGVGLYRTEYLFLSSPTPPDEEEQVAVYREVIESAPNQTVTIRTLDLGGDKTLSYLGGQREVNPFMGFRSIRLSTAYPEFFQTQLRAILRAGVHGRIRLLFPMISTLEEIHRLKSIVQRTKLSLLRSGIAHASDVPLGAMIEVPGAALCIDQLLTDVDFVSIGSNDLIQYLMAADRDNPKVAHLCEPFSPPVMRLLQTVIGTCNERGKSVTLCGEMAGLPRCFLPLFGMGLRSFSMSPGFIPSIKELTRRCTQSQAQKIAGRVLGMSTVTAIRSYLTRKVRKLCPQLTLLDVSQ